MFDDHVDDGPDDEDEGPEDHVLVGHLVVVAADVTVREVPVCLFVGRLAVVVFAQVFVADPRVVGGLADVSFTVCWKSG